jgi:putative sterol carrier protein
MEETRPTAREIIESIPERFKPEKAGDLSATIHMDVSGDDGGQFTVVVKDGAITLYEGLIGDCTSSLRGKSKDFVDVEIGKLNPAMAIMFGKAKVTNLNELLRFKGCFDQFPS